MHESKLDAGEASENRHDALGPQHGTGEGRFLPEFLRFIDEREAGVHGLHPQDLVIALLVVEH